MGFQKYSKVRRGVDSENREELKVRSRWVMKEVKE
jgi:hypothetical protein